MACGIYLLTHIASGKKYVGQSINVSRRLYWHSVGKRDTNISRAIKKYGFSAFSVDVIEECLRADLNCREEHWIKLLNCLAPNGYNLTTGGRQAEFSEETMQKLRYAQQNRTSEHVANKTAAAKRPETRRKISEKMKGRTFSEATKEKLSNAMQGRVFRPETLKAMSESAKKRNPSFVARMTALHKGRKLTEDHKLKLSNALTNPSAETREKMSAAATGRKHSAETIQAMLDSRKTEAWRVMCAKGTKGVKQTPEQIAKRVAATAASKAANRLLRQNASIAATSDLFP